MKLIKTTIIAALCALLAVVIGYVINSVFDYFRYTSIKSIALYIAMCVVFYLAYVFSQSGKDDEREHWEDK
ncbi:hypothetical protein CSW98_01415 [Vibrio sp. HA2012]|uniref:hypothetical protein n=1 Tax=Vibrio sp. HA2012 TaxID=1971595 RepID=UPI000C2C6658|nr:hypothetical protein [Vibrio sp. HA2012]PJC87812.1 hypothetical protein CSW98_01415 [Vibrio sp. HA2012]